jgi:hypothetical protein
MATKYGRSKGVFIEYSPAVQEVPGSISGWYTTLSDALCKGCRIIWLWSSLSNLAFSGTNLKLIFVIWNYIYCWWIKTIHPYVHTVYHGDGYTLVTLHTLHIHTAFGVVEDSSWTSLYIVGGWSGEGYNLHVHTADGVDGYNLHIYTAGGARYTLHVHWTDDVERCTLHVHTAGGVDGYTLHVHTSDGVDGYILHSTLVAMERDTRYTLHIHSADDGEGYILNVHTAGGVDGYTLYIHTVYGVGDGYNLHIHIAYGVDGYNLHIYTAGAGEGYKLLTVDSNGYNLIWLLMLLYLLY